MTAPQERILVIRHGALGDVVLSTGAFAAIRQHHPRAEITLLTTKLYAELLAPSPYFDAIVVDEKPRWWQIARIKKLKKFLSQGRFTRVYDLQTSQRSTWYFRLLPTPKPEFSGLAKGASHRHHTPERTRLHTIERQKQQLAIAGIADVPPPDTGWLKGSRHATAEKYALLVPGGSAHRPEKRWPKEYYEELARWLSGQGIQPVLIGTEAEAALLAEITRHGVDSASSATILNLCNRTSFADIAELARGAVVAIGNDTGPLHLIAAAGCPCIALFNIKASRPELCAPRGKVTVLSDDSLENISSQGVISVLQKYIN